MAVIMAMGNGQWAMEIVWWWWWWWWWMCAFESAIAIERTTNDWNVYYIPDSRYAYRIFIIYILNCKNVNLLFVLFCWSVTEYRTLNAGWMAWLLLYSIKYTKWRENKKLGKNVADFEYNMIFYNDKFFPIFPPFHFLDHSFIFIFASRPACHFACLQCDVLSIIPYPPIDIEAATRDFPKCK